MSEVGANAISGRERLAFLLGLGVVLFGVYGLVGAHQVDAELHTLETGIDRAIGYSTIGVLFYGAYYPVLIAPLTILTSRRVAWRAALGLCVLVAVGLPFWWFYPVTVPRPPVDVEGTLSWGVVMVRYIDPPTNCFPSMHVGAAAFASLLVWRHDEVMGVVCLTITAGIWLGSVMIAQHWFVDGLCGVAIAVLVDRVAYRGLPDAAFEARDRRWHWVWVAVYGIAFLVAASPWWFGWVDPQAVTNRW